MVEEASERVYNFLTAMTMELQMLARACGKTNVHSLEPEDLAALTVEASAMARVPPADHVHRRQTEREILAEVQRLLAIKAEDELTARPTVQIHDLRTIEWGSTLTFGSRGKPGFRVPPSEGGEPPGSLYLLLAHGRNIRP